MTNLPKEVEERIRDKTMEVIIRIRDGEKFEEKRIVLSFEELRHMRRNLLQLVWEDILSSFIAGSTIALNILGLGLTTTPDTDVQDECCEKCYYAGDIHPNAYGKPDPNTEGCTHESCQCHTNLFKP